MTQGLFEETEKEEAAIKAHAELTAAKEKEIAALTTAIEEKSTRVGNLGVSVANMKIELEDTQAALDEDKAFLADMEANCDTKSKEWDTIVKTRSEEIVAISETIKILNDDDALELFKKAIPTAASFVQLR